MEAIGTRLDEMGTVAKRRRLMGQPVDAMKILSTVDILRRAESNEMNEGVGASCIKPWQVLIDKHISENYIFSFSVSM